ncbi:hypothetical protein COS78_03510 [Candidatus Shapirobacteria bacterium CG06_land_8_20_14_3_00_40_12]|uniref:Nucleotidyl transferase AbiEii/AbiGii toxin family protein n=2 Tax=Candidatus Shapironibacteriota TaxID=1752721 RepID=A0A2M7TTP3_9BACT|nr:MAG: hypothetical protein COS78_03510 [Candidatus Shapirobacteria bacterium CG06_land_8_20_14_3_00_40_12]PIZ60319.1 MAG: hypothetical protein COY20_01285 [Candidatus Shapirobacteria bacterium CG_4_10_14_0_2_um_filter_40_12]
MYTMLTQSQAQLFAAENKTVVDNVLKEHYQIYILDQLYQSGFADSLVFKGGTALRLAYSSVRFSEDLDFSLLNDVDFVDFQKSVKQIVHMFPQSKIQDIYDKYHTLYAKIVFRVDFKPIPIGIKIEINKNRGQVDFVHTIGLSKSPFNNLEVVTRMFTLEAVLKDKLEILENNTRRQPRDLFDAWYICQKLHQEFKIEDRYKYSRKELMDGLNPLLPYQYQKTMDLFTL